MKCEIFVDVHKSVDEKKRLDEFLISLNTKSKGTWIYDIHVIATNECQYLYIFYEEIE